MSVSDVAGEDDLQVANVKGRSRAKLDSHANMPDIGCFCAGGNRVYLRC
jgi:hypothetical protein